MPLTGRRDSSTKPVRTVPTIDPTVPTPDSRPTTVPVSARLVSRTFVTSGVTADSSAPGTRIVSAATRISSGLAHSATLRRTAGVRATTAPETPSAGARSRSGSTWSAMRPPSHEPSAIAVRAMPITSVLVSRVRPRYGASRRRATISTTSTAAEAPNTSTAAVRGPSPGRLRVLSATGEEDNPVTGDILARGQPPACRLARDLRRRPRPGRPRSRPSGNSTPDKGSHRRSACRCGRRGLRWSGVRRGVRVRLRPPSRTA